MAWSIPVFGVLLVAVLRFVLNPIVKHYKQSLDVPTWYEQEADRRKDKMKP